jgi:hypothetical protein
MKAYDVAGRVTCIDAIEFVAVDAAGESILDTVILPVELIVNIPLIAPSVLMQSILSGNVDIKVFIHMNWWFGPAHHPRTHHDTPPPLETSKVAEGIKLREVEHIPNVIEYHGVEIKVKDIGVPEQLDLTPPPVPPMNEWVRFNPPDLG